MDLRFCKEIANRSVAFSDSGGMAVHLPHAIPTRPTGGSAADRGVRPTPAMGSARTWETRQSRWNFARSRVLSRAAWTALVLAHCA
jgi:hypothetical protein